MWQELRMNQSRLEIRNELLVTGLKTRNLRRSFKFVWKYKHDLNFEMYTKLKYFYDVFIGNTYVKLDRGPSERHDFKAGDEWRYDT